MKEALGTLAVVVSLCGYAPYLRDVLRGRTKPHAISWFIWGTLATVLFAAAISNGAGAGAWVTAVVVIMSTVIFVLALFRGEKHVTALDWACLVGAAAVGLAWMITGGPLLSVILATCIDILGFVPTFRKSIAKPHEETVVMWGCSAAFFFLASLAIERYSVITTLNPALMVFIDSAMVVMLLTRRRVLPSQLTGAREP